MSRLIEVMIWGGLSVLKTRAPRLAKNPPSATSLSSMICGSPGAHVRCSTGLLRSSQTLAGSGFSSPTSTGNTRALTAADVHSSPVGR